MKKALQVTKKDLLLLLKDRGAVISMLAVPLVLMAIIGSVFNFSSNGDKFSVPLPVVNQDGAAGKAFTDVLSSTGALKIEFASDETAANKRLSDTNNSAAAYIVIPQGFGDALQGKGNAKLSLVRSPNDTSRAAAVEGIINSIISSYTNSLIAGQIAVEQVGRYAGPNFPAEQVRGEAMSAAGRLSQNPSVALASSNAQVPGQQASGFDIIVPGYALMFALFAIVGGAGSIIEEKEAGTFKRLLLTPIRPYALIAGKMGAQYITGVLQVTLLFLVGIFVFGAHPGNIPGLIMLILAVPFAATGLGMLLVSLVKSRRQLQPITTVIVLGSSAISGTWFPLWLEPQWLQNASRVTMNTWAIEGFNNLMIFGKDFSDVLPNILVLFAYGLICYLLATRFFKVKEGESATAG